MTEDWFIASVSLSLMCIIGITYKLGIENHGKRPGIKPPPDGTVPEAEMQKKEIGQGKDNIESRSGFFTDIAHEFKMPLTLITAPLRNLIKNNSTMPEAERLKTLKLIAENSERLLQMVDQSKNASPKKEEINSRDMESEFLRKCIEFVYANLDNSELSSEDFCKYMGMSQTQLYRKLLAITGMPISDFVQSHRLKKASLLLQSGKYTVAEIAYQVGFKDPSYFTKCFVKRFGSTPSKYSKAVRPGYNHHDAHTEVHRQLWQ